METVGSIVGIVLATVLASRFYPYLAHFVGDSNLMNILSFVIIFSASVKLVSLLFWLFGKIFQIITVLPLISTFDSLLGLILGFVEGVFILSVILYFMLKFPVNSWIVEQMTASPITNVLLKIAYLFIPLFPEAINKLKAII